MPTRLPGNTSLTRVSTNPEFTIGKVFETEDSSGRYAAYKYVQFLDAVTYAAGHLVEWADTAGTKVTNDRVGGSSKGRCPAGIAMAVHTQNSYGFIQVGGVALVYCDGSVATGEAVITHATADGQGDTGVSGTGTVTIEQMIGYALDDDSTSNDPLATLAMSHVALNKLF